MTIREFVERGAVGTRDQRERFETAMLEGWADAAEHGFPMPSPDSADASLWVLGFEFWKGWQDIAKARSH
jgi:hypothetical protein